MATELLEIQPHELKFTFELKKQSSCSVQLTNRSDQYVAFKLKTTSPKQYCVRPNIGVIKPKAACDFTVTMQAQKVAPPDLQCKDKFLVQSTVVPVGTAEEDLTADMFSKGVGKHVEEKKLRVFLVSPLPSPVLLPNNGELTKDPPPGTLLHSGMAALSGIENIPPPHGIPEDVLCVEAAKDNEELRVANDLHTRAPGDMGEEESAKDTAEQKLVKDFEELRSKIYEMDSKLKAADQTIMKLADERGAATREKDILKREVEILRMKNSVRRVQVGFPLLYVCVVALISLAFGYLIHP